MFLPFSLTWTHRLLPRRPPVWVVRAGGRARRPGHVPDDRGQHPSATSADPADLAHIAEQWRAARARASAGRDAASATADAARAGTDDRRCSRGGTVRLHMGPDMMMPMGMMPMMNQGFAGPTDAAATTAAGQQVPATATAAAMETDSAYQRQPVNNRRRNIKRERPSDFLEVAGLTQRETVRLRGTGSE
jgi:hypothetical protein